MYCYKCGVENKEGDKFCYKCGEKLCRKEWYIMKLHKITLILVLLSCLIVPYDRLAVRENCYCGICDAGYGFILGGPFSNYKLYSISMNRVFLEFIAIGAINYYLVNRKK